MSCREDHRAGDAGLRGRRCGAPGHIVDFYARLGGGLRDATWDGSARSVARLAILPGHTHYDIFGSPDLVNAVIPFLDAASLEPPAPYGA